MCIFNCGLELLKVRAGQRVGVRRESKSKFNHN